jgi:tripeptide aminopeptidase
MQDDGYPSELARELAPDALERFLRYVQIDTQSDPRSTAFPSTEKQLDLLRLLADECRDLALEDVELDEHGYVMATVPATAEGKAPTIGFLAHVDTYPGVIGTGVKPQVVRYEGGDLPLPGDPAQVLTPRDMPLLADHVGHELVTSDGTTLLGADDKAGVAEIMAAAAYLVRHPELPHGRVRVAFTPDEEIGRGANRFDLGRFGAEVAYTLDGARRGEIEDETFSADKATLRFRGRSAHTGTAKGVLVNAVKAAGDFLAALPRDSLSPETTDELEGFVHPDEIAGNIEETTVVVILRDFQEERLQEHGRLVRRLAEEAAAGRGADVEITFERQYTNMKQFITDTRIVEAAEEAIRRAGMEPKRERIRGGTDGSLLSELGLPSPNLSTGGHDYHSRREWICVADMGAAASTIVHLAQVWGELGKATLRE